MVFVAACGGTVQAKSDTDAGAAATGNACVEFDPSSYDRSCQMDDDCIPIFAGTLCPGYACACPTGTISSADEARYRAAFASVAPSEQHCLCPATGGGRCILGQCVWCPANFASGAPVFVCPVDGG